MSGRQSSRILIGLLTLIVGSLPVFGTDIAGRVIDDRGQGIPEVRLQLVGTDGLSPTVITNLSGAFAARLPPGDYLIYDAKNSSLLARVEVGETPIHVELKLKRAVTATISTSWEIVEPPDEVQQLRSIADYRVFSNDVALPSLKNSAEVFNPFLAKRPRLFHGTLYEFHRNDYFDARNFFDPVGQPLPEYKRNQFGVQLSGTLWERLTILGSFDGLRIVQGATEVSHVPTAAQKRGDFGSRLEPLIDPLTGAQFPNNAIPSDRLNPVAMRMLSVIPDPNQDDPDRNFINSQPRVTNEDRYSFRVDYQWADDTKLVGNYSFNNRQEVRIEPLPNFNSDRLVDHQNLRLGLDHRFTDRFLASFSAQFSRNVDLLLSVNSGQIGLLESIGIEGLRILDETDEGYPEFRISGYASVGDDRSPETGTRNDLRLNSDFSYSWDKHSLSFGTRLNFNQINDDRTGGNRRGSFEFNGSFTGDAFADFLLGYPESASRGLGSDRADLRGRYYEAFFRDSWKINEHFDLTLSLTYQYTPPWRSLAPVSGFFPLTLDGQPGDFVISGTEQARQLGFQGHTLVRPDRNDFSPRIGLAYSPRGNNSLVIRSGYWIFHHSIGQDRFIENMTRNHPFFSQQEAVSSVFEPQIDLKDPFAHVQDSAITVKGIEPDARTTYTQGWNLAIQQRLGRNLNFEIRYQGNHTVGAQRRLPGNVPLPGPGDIQSRRPNPVLGVFDILTTDGHRTENSLHLDVERQLANGFSIKSGFRWSRNINDIIWGSAANSRNFSIERAPDDDPEKTFFVNYIYQLPFGNASRESGLLNRMISGWKLSGATRLSDGRRFTVRLSGDFNNDGLGGDRPDRIGSGQLPSGRRGVNAWFDTSAFVEPEAFRTGTSGRNILKSPGLHTWDVSLIKTTSLANGHFLEFRVQLFNALNQVNFQRPNTSLGTDSFGQIFGAGEAREVEIALKYSF